jgi:hypothetical protein
MTPYQTHLSPRQSGEGSNRYALSITSGIDDQAFPSVRESDATLLVALVTNAESLKDPVE